MNDQALGLYRKACGLKAPLVLECDGASRCASTSFLRTFDCPFVLIGRDPRSDFVLDISTVSRRHVFLHAIAGRLLVIDLQSRTKVYWEGEEAPRDAVGSNPASSSRLVRTAFAKRWAMPVRIRTAHYLPSSHPRNNSKPKPFPCPGPRSSCRSGQANPNRSGRWQGSSPWWAAPKIVNSS